VEQLPSLRVLNHVATWLSCHVRNCHWNSAFLVAVITVLLEQCRLIDWVPVRVQTKFAFFIRQVCWKNPELLKAIDCWLDSIFQVRCRSKARTPVIGNSRISGTKHKKSDEKTTLICSFDLQIFCDIFHIFLGIQGMSSQGSVWHLIHLLVYNRVLINSTQNNK
jgi:hypothetical protein